MRTRGCNVMSVTRAVVCCVQATHTITDASARILTHSHRHGMSGVRDSATSTLKRSELRNKSFRCRRSASRTDRLKSLDCNSVTVNTCKTSSTKQRTVVDVHTVVKLSKSWTVVQQLPVVGMRRTRAVATDRMVAAVSSTSICALIGVRNRARCRRSMRNHTL